PARVTAPFAISPCRRECDSSGQWAARKWSSRQPLCASPARNSQVLPFTDDVSAMAQSDVKPSPSYRGLLALVIILGVLIVLSVVALIVAAVLRAGNRPPAGEAYAASVPAPGERIESTQLDGNRILLRLS